MHLASQPCWSRLVGRGPSHGGGTLAMLACPCVLAEAPGLHPCRWVDRKSLPYRCPTSTKAGGRMCVQATFKSSIRSAVVLPLLTHPTSRHPVALDAGNCLAVEACYGHTAHWTWRQRLLESCSGPCRSGVRNITPTAHQSPRWGWRPGRSAGAALAASRRRCRPRPATES